MTLLTRGQVTVCALLHKRRPRELCVIWLLPETATSFAMASSNNVTAVEPRRGSAFFVSPLVRQRTRLARMRSLGGPDARNPKRKSRNVSIG